VVTVRSYRKMNVHRRIGRDFYSEVGTLRSINGVDGIFGLDHDPD